MRLFIAEKPQVAMAIAEALSDINNTPVSRKDGYILCGKDAITWCLGHLLQLQEPETINPDWAIWKAEDLPIWLWPPRYCPRTRREPGKPPAEDPAVLRQLNVISSLARQASRIVHAGEPDKPEPVHGVNKLPLRQVVSSAVATRDAATQHIRDRLPATPDAVTQPQSSAERAAPPDTSTQATAGEQRMAENLKRADERNIFTVPLSEGHERTLYVFSDPSCPHCRDIEPVLERLSGSFNIRIFPVSVIGGEKSASMAQKVLCESDATARRSAWKALFSPGEEMLFPVKTESGDTKAASDCELASRAVSVNDKAFRAYQFAGTPWVLSDRGQAVPQGLLNNATEVALWLKLNDNTTKAEK